MKNFLEEIFGNSKKRRKGIDKMSLTQLETSLFESVEFCLALLGTIPVPICIVGKSNKIVPLNTVKLTCPDKIQQICCGHNEKTGSWEFESGTDCILCKVIEECRTTKQKIIKKGPWRALTGHTPREFIIVVHAIYTKIKDDEFVLVGIEDLTEVEQLKGLLPICMVCNKIHDCKSQKWVRIDEYVTDRSPAKFSHGLCPECSKHMMSNIER